MLMVVLFPPGSCGFKRQHFFLISQDASQMEVNDGVAVNVRGTSSYRKHLRVFISHLHHNELFLFFVYSPTRYSFLQLIFHYQVTDCFGDETTWTCLLTEQNVLFYISSKCHFRHLEQILVTK